MIARWRTLPRQSSGEISQSTPLPPRLSWPPMSPVIRRARYTARRLWLTPSRVSSRILFACSCVILKLLIPTIAILVRWLLAPLMLRAHGFVSVKMNRPPFFAAVYGTHKALKLILIRFLFFFRFGKTHLAYFPSMILAKFEALTTHSRSGRQTLPWLSKPFDRLVSSAM